MNRKWACALLGGSLLLMGNGGGLPGKLVPTDPPSAVSKQQAVYALAQITLKEVNGISLHDDRETVVAKLGVPIEIIRDPLIADLEIYRYEGFEVAFSGIYVQDVSIPSDSGSFTLDGVEVEIAPASIRAKLGNPDYAAEDGLIYQRGSNLLKVYLDVERGRIDMIRYYSLSDT